MRPRFVAACLGVAAVACFVVAYLNRNAELEGAYFESSREGWTPYAPVENSIFSPFDLWDGYLWLGAGLAFALAALAVLALGRFASRFAPAV